MPDLGPSFSQILQDSVGGEADSLSCTSQRSAGFVEPRHLLNLLLGRRLLTDLNSGIDEFLGYCRPVTAILLHKIDDAGTLSVPRNHLLGLLSSQGLLVLPQPGTTRGFGWRWCRATAGIPGREVGHDLADPRDELFRIRVG